MPRTILYVRGFHPNTRARDLAYEFERYGTLVRCDIPAPRGASSASPYAFVEFRSARDSSEAFRDMHGRHFEGQRLTVEWAKRLPSSMWRSGARSPPRRSRNRSRSPRRDDDKDDRRRRSRSRSRDRRDDDRENEKARRHSESPAGRRRSLSRGRDSDKARSPAPRDREESIDGLKKENGVDLDNTPALSEA